MIVIEAQSGYESCLLLLIEQLILIQIWRFVLQQMSNHQEIPEDIRKQLDDFESKLNNLRSLKGVSKDDAISKHQKHAKRIHRLLETYQYSIQSGAFQNGVASHKSQYKEFEVKLARLQKTLDTFRNDNGTEEELFKHRNKSGKNIENNNRQMVIEAGDRAQQEGVDALGRIQKNIVGMDQQADAVLTELDRQINKLDQIYDELSDTQTTLKRAQQHLKYFARQVYTDRCLVFIIILIAIAIIVIIALAIAGKTPKQMNNQVTKL